MSSTIGVPSGAGGTEAEVEVLGCDAAGTVAFLVAQRRVEERAATEQMRAVCHFADLHRVGHVGAVDRVVEGGLAA